MADAKRMDLDNRIGESLSTDYFLLRTEFTPTQLDYLCLLYTSDAADE